LFNPDVRQRFFDEKEMKYIIDKIIDQVSITKAELLLIGREAFQLTSKNITYAICPSCGGKVIFAKENNDAFSAYCARCSVSIEDVPFSDM